MKIKYRKQKDVSKILKWLQNKDFDKAYTTLIAQPTKTHLEAYYLGLCHLKLGHPLECLCAWLPTLDRLKLSIEPDCQTVIGYLMNQPGIIDELHSLPLSQLMSLAQALRRFNDHSQEFYQVRQILFQRLWDCKEFGQLFKFINTKKETKSPVWIINYAKTGIHINKNKAFDALKFIGHFLSAAAHFSITRSYICPFPEAMDIMGEELSRFLSSSQSLSPVDQIHREGFQRLIQKEIQILKENRQGIEEASSAFFPTPTLYYCQPEFVDLSLIEKAGKNQTTYFCHELYDRNNYERFLTKQGISTRLREITQSMIRIKNPRQHSLKQEELPFHLLLAYFRHFLISRNEIFIWKMAKYLREAATPSNKNQLNQSFVSIYLQLTDRTSRQHFLDIATTIFEPDVWWDNEMAQRLCHLSQSLYGFTGTRFQNLLHKLAPKITDEILKQQIIDVMEQVQERLRFGSSFIRMGFISRIKSKAEAKKTLAQFYSLFQLCFPDHPFWFDHGEVLLKNFSLFMRNKKINKLLPDLLEYLDDALEVGLSFEYIYEEFFEDIFEHFHISPPPFLKLTFPEIYSSNLSEEETPITPDLQPFEQLDLPLNCSKKMVLNQVMQKMRHEPHRMQEYRNFQHKIFTSRWRLLNEFYGQLEPEDPKLFQGHISKIEHKHIKKIALRC